MQNEKIQNLIEKYEDKSLKVVDLRQLKEINKQSIECGYNRNIEFSKFTKSLREGMQNAPKKGGSWSGMKTKVVVQPLMHHSHKGGQECEVHMRCFVDTPVTPAFIIDIPMNVFNLLMSLEVTLGLQMQVNRLVDIAA